MSDDTSLSPEAPAITAKAGSAAVGLAYNSVIQIINMNGGGLSDNYCGCSGLPQNLPA